MRTFFILFLFCLLGNQSYAFGAWTQQADFGGIARHRTIMITIGNRIYTGLGHYNGAGTNVLFNDWWEFDPGSNAWTQKADYGGGICYHAAGFTINNIAYVGTGRITPSGSTLVKSFFKYEATTNTWTPIADFPGVGRRGAVAFVIGNYGYVGTGETDFGVSSDFYRYDPSIGTWQSIASMSGDRTSSVAFAIDNYGYAGTGSTSFGSTNDFQRYNPATNSWQMMAPVGPTDRLEACGFAVGGKGYIGTGADFSSGNNFGDMWEFDPVTGSWVQLADFPGTARRYLSGTSVGNFGYVGLGTNGTNFKDFWKFDQTVSLMERNIDDLEIVAYPNPSVDVVNFIIKWNENVPTSEMSLTISSLTGQIVFSSLLHELKEINTSDWNSGSYIYSLKYNNQSVKNGQIIVY